MPKRDARSTLVDDPSWLLKVERGTKYMGKPLTLNRAHKLSPQGEVPCAVSYVSQKQYCPCY